MAAERMSFALLILASTIAGTMGVVAFMVQKNEPEPSAPKIAVISKTSEKGLDSSQPTSNSAEAETDTADSATPILQGALMDGRGGAVASGDVLYKFMAVQDKSCNASTGVSFDLDGSTGVTQGDRRGRFAIPLPEKSEHDESSCLHLHASRQGYAATVVSLDPEVHKGPIELELEKHQTIAGQVNSPGGRGLGGATVSSWIGNDGESKGEQLGPCEKVDQSSMVSSISAEDGKFLLGASGDNQFCIQASHPDWASSTRQLISSAEVENQDIALTLQAPKQLAGQVLDQDKQPVAKLELQLSRNDDIGGSGSSTVHSDAAGEFVFRKLDAAVYQLRSGDPAYAVATPREVTVKPRGSIDDLKVSVFPLTSITGRIVDDQGNPLGGARISTRSPYVPDLSGTSGLSDESGYFRVYSEHRSKVVREMLRMAGEFSEASRSGINPENPPPVVCISFYHRGFRGEELAVSVSDASLDIGTVYMSPPLLTFEGLVKNHRDEPTAAELTFNYIDERRNSGSEPPLSCDESTSPLEVSAGDDGQFALHLDRPGRYEVEVKTQRYQTRRLQLDLNGGSEVVEIKLN